MHTGKQTRARKSPKSRTASRRCAVSTGSVARENVEQALIFSALSRRTRTGDPEMHVLADEVMRLRRLITTQPVIEDLLLRGERIMSAVATIEGWKQADAWCREVWAIYPPDGQGVCRPQNGRDEPRP